MLENIQTEQTKRLYIGPATIKVTDIKMNEETPIGVNQYSEKKEARIDVSYSLFEGEKELINDQFFSFYVSEEPFESERTGKKQYITDSCQFIWATDPATAKKGFQMGTGSDAYWIIHPSENVHPAYKKLEPFVNFLTSLIRFNPRSGSVADLYSILSMESIFTDTKVFQEKLAQFVSEIKEKGMDQVRVLFLVDDQQRMRIDTKNAESFAFAYSGDFKAIKRAIKKKSDSSYPYISGVYSLTFQEYDPTKLGQYAEEIAELSGVDASAVDGDEWEV